MSRTLQETIDIAVERSGAPDAEARAESLLELAVSKAADYYAADDTRASALHETKTVALSNGSFTLQSDVWQERVGTGRLYDPADTSKRYVHLRNWDDFTDGGKDSRLGYWTVKGGVLFAIEPAAAYAEGSGATTTLKLTCLISPAVPTSDSGTWTVADEVVETIIDFLAALLAPPKQAAK